MKLLLPVFLALPLAGCYTVHQDRFAAYAGGIVQVGMPMAQAQQRLSAEGFSCGPRDFAPAVSCTRTRQSLLPYTCIERVNLVPAMETQSIDSVQVPPIVCAGL